MTTNIYLKRKAKSLISGISGAAAYWQAWDMSMKIADKYIVPGWFPWVASILSGVTVVVCMYWFISIPLLEVRDEPE